MIPRDTPNGLLIETPAVRVFFGNRDSSFENLQLQFPEQRWARIRQTHSDFIVSAREGTAASIEADAHFTDQKDLGLIISTADCVPIMLADTKAGRVAAVHAGWRGVATRILPKTIDALMKAGSEPRHLFAWIGPHIQMPSFEVETAVKEQLIAARGPDSTEADFSSSLGGGKYLLDLNGIVKSQLGEFNFPPDQVFDFHIDTKTATAFHSHRRDREKAGRNLSFISAISR